MTDERNALLELLKKYFGRRTNVSGSTRLYHDLFLMGDDADEFLTEIHQIFGTRFDGFHFSVYFPNETDAGLTWVATKMFGYKGKWLPFTFKHLCAVVARGEWFEPAA